jgi:DNA-binding NarL/FixJ family response regulator
VTIRVTLADDEPLVLGGLRMVLETDSELEIVGEAPDGQQALELIRATRPDIALVDIRMPVMDGIALTRAVVADPALDACRIVLLTTFADDGYLVEAARAGASGYLLKSMPPADIRSGLHIVVRGGTALAPALVGRLLAEYAGRRVAADPVLERLIVRESDVLHLIARGRSNQEIAAELFVSEGTVKTHVAAILRKLGLRDRTQAVVAAYELGLVRPGDDC